MKKIQIIHLAIIVIAITEIVFNKNVIGFVLKIEPIFAGPILVLIPVYTLFGISCYLYGNGRRYIGRWEVGEPWEKGIFDTVVWMCISIPFAHAVMPDNEKTFQLVTIITLALSVIIVTVNYFRFLKKDEYQWQNEL